MLTEHLGGSSRHPRIRTAYLVVSIRLLRSTTRTELPSRSYDTTSMQCTRAKGVCGDAIGAASQGPQTCSLSTSVGLSEMVRLGSATYVPRARCRSRLQVSAGTLGLHSLLVRPVICPAGFGIRFHHVLRFLHIFRLH